MASPSTMSEVASGTMYRRYTKGQMNLETPVDPKENKRSPGRQDLTPFSCLKQLTRLRTTAEKSPSVEETSEKEKKEPKRTSLYFRIALLLTLSGISYILISRFMYQKGIVEKRKDPKSVRELVDHLFDISNHPPI